MNSEFKKNTPEWFFRFLLLVALAGTGLLLRLSLSSPLATRILPPDQIRHDRGFAFVAPFNIPEDAAPSLSFDALRKLRNSPVGLLENKAPLPGRHAIHGQIRELGGGRYSHWGPWIYFSASDNSDPRTNGRIYEALYPARPLSPWAPIAGGAACVLLILGRKKLKRGVARLANGNRRPPSRKTHEP